MAKEFSEADDALLAQLGVEVEPQAAARRSPQDERIIAGFAEIQRFVAEHGHAPQAGEENDIFERLYAVRLDRMREQADCRVLLERLDHQGLLAPPPHEAGISSEALDDDALLAALGVDAESPSISQLKHVRSSEEKRSAEEIARRDQCEDFPLFKPRFAQVQKELAAGLRVAHPFEGHAQINVGDFFIVGGQKAYVAEKGRQSFTKEGKKDARLRVIFDNGTENRMLMRSLQRALYKDNAGRRITEAVSGPLFVDHTTEADEASGTIYVLRSHSKLPFVVENRHLLHKIGVTSGKVEHRISTPELDPTFLMAGVETVATYQLYNINGQKLEKLIHRVFELTQVNIEVKDRFGRPVTPREWFLVPRHIIDEVVKKIQDGTITNYIYDPQEARLQPVT